MKRRTFLSRSAAWTAASLCLEPLEAQGGKYRVNRSRISAISDEIAQSPEEAIAFAHHFGLQWLELRGVPALPGESKPYFFLPDDQLKSQAKLLHDGGIKISFMNSNLLKRSLPGTTRASQKAQTPEAHAKQIALDQAEYDARFDNLGKCIRSAHAFECKYVRVFTFLRVATPPELYDRIANVVGEMAERATKEGVMLLVENEPSCNVGDSAELAQFLPKLPESTVGFNWDARNATGLQEIPFPDGYRLLPKHRMHNAQIKGHDMLDPSQPIDWAPIFAAMDEDGYREQIGLETHYFDGTNLERSHMAMDKIVKLADANAART